MTYLGVLLLFALPPLLLLIAVESRYLWKGHLRSGNSPAHAPYLVVIAHVVVALVYTSPWDNYLVASRVWWYSERLVLGIRIGWVPIEEYCFFMVQTVITGLWILWLMRNRFPRVSTGLDMKRMRFWTSMAVALAWLASFVIWLIDWAPGTYLTLIMVWALIPVLIQVAFGADILWNNRKLIVVATAIPTVYFWILDSMAMKGGTWTLDPAQTLGVKLFGVLPLEEMVFFLMTNLLITFGVTLVLSPQGQERASRLSGHLVILFGERTEN